MHGVVCLCVDLLFVCEMAVGNVLCCAVMVGVYVHALAFVDARVRYSCGVLAVRDLHWCDDASGVWLAFVGALGARVIASCGYHTSTMGARSL